MIRSENAPTLCPRCIHFKKGIDTGCKIGNYGTEGAVAESIQRWKRQQNSESSWTYMGACPQFMYNDTGIEFMSKDDQRAFKLLILDKGEQGG